MDYTKLYHSLQADEDFRAVSKDGQHLYFWLLASPTLNYAGVCDWRIPRMVDWWPGASIDAIRDAAEELRAARFVFTDDRTEEALIRTFVRWDGLMKQRNLAVSMRRAYNSIASNTLRSINLWELHRLHDDQPNLVGWEKVADLLAKPRIDPRVDPAVDPTIYPKVDPSIRGEPKGGSDPSVEGPATTTTTTTSPYAHQNPVNKLTSTKSKKQEEPPTFAAFWDAYGKKIKRAVAVKSYTKALTKTDAPTLLKAATEFIASERARPDFDIQFVPDPSTWLNQERWTDERASRSQPLPPTQPLTPVHELREPPNGLTNEELSRWYADDEKRRKGLNG